MSVIIWLATELYSAMIRLYPISFRQEFGAEMVAVFSESIVEAEGENKRHLFATILREIRDLPFTLLREHWRNFSNSEPNLMTIIRKPTWFFYPAWIILTALCVTVAFPIYFVINQVVETLIGDVFFEDQLFSYIFVPTAGILMGLAQYVLLRTYLPRMGWWVLATAGGWSLGLVLMSIVIFRALTYFLGDEAIYASWAIPLALILMGLSIGFGQWLLLRRRLPRAGWWIAANALGWGLLGVMATGDAMDELWLLGMAMGLAPACVTAATLAMLMNPLRPAEVRR